MQLSKVLSIFYENMRSVVKKKKHLFLSTTDAFYDIIVICETWLKNSHKNNEFISESYNIFRKDRMDSSVSEDSG